MCSRMISLPPWSLKAVRFGLVESISCETSSTRCLCSSGLYLVTSNLGSLAKTYCMPPAPKIQAMPLVGLGGCAGGVVPSHQETQPPAAPKGGLFSPETPQPG